MLMCWLLQPARDASVKKERDARGNFPWGFSDKVNDIAKYMTQLCRGIQVKLY